MYQVVADLFPAIIALAPQNSVQDLTSFRPTYRDTHPEGTRMIDRARITLTDTKVLIAVDSPTGPTLVFREDYTEYVKDRALKEHYIRTQSGKILSVAKDQNCGCGSRLRSWSPFGNILNATDPTEF
jgi:hypothetical protein